MATKNFDLSVILKMVDRFTTPLKQSMLNMKNAVRDIQRADTAMKRFGTSMLASGKSIRKAGKSMSMFLTLPLTGLGLLSLRTASNFDSAMNMVGAVTRTQIGDSVLPAFKELREEAKRLGSTTQFTASEVAGGMQFLGMAGIGAADILKVIPKVLELAASAQLDMASAANIVTNIMASQKMGVDQLSRANDVLVSSFTRANVDLQMLGESFKYAGNVTRDAGVSIEEAAAAFGLMGQQGIQASLAGTSLRGAMARMMAPSNQLIKLMSELGLKVYKMKDGEPVLKSLVEIVREFEKAGLDSGNMIEMFGLRAGPGFAALVSEGSDKLQKFIDLMKEDVGLAAAVAKAQMMGLPGAIKSLASAWEGLQLAVMESGFGQMVVSIIDKFAQFLRELNKTNPAMLTFVASSLAVIAILGPLIALFGLLVISIGAIAANIGIIAAVAGVIALIGIAITGVIGLIKLLPIVFKNTIEGIKTLGKELLAFFEYIPIFINNAIQSVAAGIESWILSISDKIKSMIPDFILNFMNKGQGQSIVGQAQANRINPSVVDRSQADVTVRVMADQNSTATVDDVKKKGGMNLNIMSDNYLGPNIAWGN